MGSKARFKNIFMSMKSRMLFSLLFSALIFLALVFALFKLQLIDYSELKARADNQHFENTVIAANRGTIYDSKMNVLAQSATTWMVVVAPNQISETNRELVAEAMVRFLGVNYDSTMALLKKTHRSYEIVKRKVEQSVVNEIREWANENSVKGILFDEDSRRYYPNDNLLSTALGFVGDENKGMYGIELYYNSYLSGTTGRVLTARNPRIDSRYYDYETSYAALPGNSLVLTVDEIVQYYLEKFVEEAMATHNVKYFGAGIVMDVNTGAILGMTTKPDFDANSPLSVKNPEVLAQLAELVGKDGYNSALLAAQQAQWVNKAIQNIYEPGSVFKVITASAALEAGTANEDSKYHCGGSMKVATHTMKCHYSKGHGSQTFVKAVSNSCNVAFIKIGQELGASNFFHYFKAFGLTATTGVDLPGESPSVYYTENQLGIVELSSCSFGQSNAVTPIQMITAVSAAVNGGYLLKPYIVSEIIDDDGAIIYSRTPTVIRQVISSETSKSISLILEQVVKNSNSVNAYVRGYRVGGKTGTSQKLGGASNEYVASFCGIAPVNDPQIAVLLLFDTPRGSSIYGGTVAAPFACKLFGAILPYLGINPAYTAEELITADVAVPSILDLTVSAATTKLKSSGLKIKVIGGGDRVVSQYPQAGSSIPKGSSVAVYTTDAAQTTVTVPNLIGKSAKSAVEALAALGLNCRISGSTTQESVVFEQSALNIELPVGSVVALNFIDYTVSD